MPVLRWDIPSVPPEIYFYSWVKKKAPLLLTRTGTLATATASCCTGTYSLVPGPWVFVSHVVGGNYRCPTFSSCKCWGRSAGRGIRGSFRTRQSRRPAASAASSVQPGPAASPWAIRCWGRGEISRTCLPLSSECSRVRCCSRPANRLECELLQWWRLSREKLRNLPTGNVRLSSKLSNHTSMTFVGRSV